MDCLQAQQVISAALDREPVDAATLAEAKSHCRECADCARFVKGLAAVQRAGMPTVPEGLAERAIATARETVGKEREAAAAAAAAAATAAAVSADEAADRVPATPTSVSETEAAPTELRAVPSKRSRTQTVIAFAAAAAVLVVFAGFAAIWGIRTIGSGGAVRTTGQAEIAAPSAAPEDQKAATDSGAATAPSAGAPSAPSAGAVSYIEFGGTAYRLNGASTEPTANLSRAGTVTTSLDTGQAPVARAVYRMAGSTALLVDGQDSTLSFSPVEYQYAGRTYALRTAPIPAFGTWPTLPSGVAAPTKADGSPTFMVESSAGGSTVYRLKSGSTAQGIAFAPGASESAGNPNWTWWTPSQ